MTDSVTHKTLFVDDNVNLLAGIKRQFRKKYEVFTAEGGAAGLETIKESGPFEVIICDMKMPEMNGIQFFTQAKIDAPESVRIMLTGNADLETAMHAVNEGNIFRFLMKPCQRSTIECAIDAGIEFYRLKKVEKGLLENTLQGCVRALTDMLSLTNPMAFGQASRISAYVKRVVEHLELKDKWIYELAASLSQIGCISVPRDTLERVSVGGDLADDEKEMYRNHPSIGKDLVCAIPRLETVGEIIGAQLNWNGNDEVQEENKDRTVTEIGSEILAVALEFDNKLVQGVSKNQAITDLRKSKKAISENLIDALKQIEVAGDENQSRMVKVSDLTDSMVIADDLFSKQGTMIASSGQALNNTVRTLLTNYVLRKEIGEEILVFIHTEESSPQKNSEKPETAVAQ